jgi:hypothetical protein
MAAPHKKTRGVPSGFDVTCVIGHVDFVDAGPHTPAEAAYLLIAQHGAEGTFSFPHENGGMVRVTVEHDGDAADDLHYS